MASPKTRYAKSGDLRIAYQMVGNGPIDLVLVPGFISDLELQWEDPGYAHLLQRLSTFARLILLDKRGTGLSDRVDAHHLPTLDVRMDDVRAVMDASGSRRAVLIGAAEGAAISILFASRYPERTRGLVLYGGYAHFQTSVMGREALADFVRTIETEWGNGASLPHCVPGRMCDPRFQTWWGRFERLSASPTAAATLMQMNASIDVRALLASIRVPALVIHRSDDVNVKFAAGRYLAQRIPGARLVELPGRDHPIWIGDIDRIVDEIEEFLTGNRPMSTEDRMLATIVVARLVAPNRLKARPGDSNRTEQLAGLHKAAREIVARHSGHSLGTGSEDVGARFDRPAPAVHCALAIRDAADAQGIELAVGVHAGEIEIRDDSIAGLAVHITQQIAAYAKAGEVLVSGVVAELAAGSDLRFSRRGSEQVDGLDDPLRLMAVVSELKQSAAGRLAGAPALDALSLREREVLALIAEGCSNAAIAQRLRLSEHTVKRHVANILLKLDLPTRAAAAAVAGSPHPA